MPGQYVSDVKNGHRPLTELFARRMADEFDCNFQWLLGLDDSPARAGLSVPPSAKEKFWLPMIGEPIAGEPREHPRWSGGYAELTGVAAAKAAQVVQPYVLQPYVLQLGHGDREGRLKINDLVLVSQAIAENAELSLVRCGKRILLARKKGAKWLRVATGEPLRGDCGVTGHCVGVVWSALM